MNVVFAKTTYKEHFIDLLNNFCIGLKEFKGTLEEIEENEKPLDKYEQIANEGKEILLILKEKINEKFRNEDKVKKSQEREREQEKRERERKYEVEKQNIEFEKERIQARRGN